MTHLGLKAELRDAETIRAYLDEVMRLKSPVQLWKAQTDVPPFETTLERVTATTFTTTTTPALPPGQVLNFSFMLDARRFITYTKVVSTGVFSFPRSLSLGERRDRLRATFDRQDRAEAFAVEALEGTLAGGRTLKGKVLDLSLQGIRFALEDLGTLSGPETPLKRGDAFDGIAIQSLPHTPTIHCSGVVTHVRQSGGGISVGFLLKGVSDGDQKNIERILARRFPATFGQAFPAMKRKTDLADLPGAPTLTEVKAKAPEVVELPAPPPPAPVAPAQRAPLPAYMRLRKLSKQILFLSANPENLAPLAEAFREDGYRHLFEAGSFLDAQGLAKRNRFDLLVLDVKVGGHWGLDMMSALRSRGLLLDTPVLLVADHRNDGFEEVAEALQAVHIHERNLPYDDLIPVLGKVLLSGG